MNLQTAIDRSASRLRLKRVFLQTLAISLITCALVAVAALLWGTFTRTTGKVLATLAALALHSGVAMFCAGMLERRRWPRWSEIGLIAFAVSFAVLVTTIWWPGMYDELTFKATGTTVSLLVFYLLAIPAADLRERGVHRPLSTWAQLACCAAFVMVFICIWGPRSESEVFGKATLVVCIVALSLAHTLLLIRVPGHDKVRHILLATFIAVWLLAVMGSLTIVYDVDAEFWYRGLGAVGVLDACGSLALLITAKIARVEKTEELEVATKRIELRCPRCTTQQTVDIGAAQCNSCGLKFRIDVDEPRCATCDYLLWQLPERRCPECGTPF